MSGEVGQTGPRLDLALFGDIGSYPTLRHNIPLGGVSGYATLLWPIGAEDDGISSSITLGGRIGVSGYFSTPNGVMDPFYKKTTKDIKCPLDSTQLIGLRIFLGPEMEVALGNIVALRFSPGMVIKYDSVYDFDIGAGWVAALVVDITDYLTFQSHFTSDIHTYDDNQQFTFGIGLGYSNQW